MSLSAEKINDYVLSKQHLAPGSKSGDVLGIVRDVMGLHASDFRTPFLSCFARSDSFSNEQLYRELYLNRTLSKIKAMRGTLFIFDRDFVPTVYTAIQGSVIKASAFYLEKYMSAFGVDKSLYEKASREILNIVGKESMDARSIKTELRKRVPDERLWKKDTMVQGGKKYTGTDAAGYIIYSLCDQCKLARVGIAGNAAKQEYIRWDRWFPEVKMRSDVAQSRRDFLEYYINSFGPVTTKDVRWWSGFSMAESTQIFDDIDTVYVDWEGKDEYFTTKKDYRKLKAHRPGKGDDAVLLPVLDGYIMGYRERGRLVEDKYEKLLYDRTGNARPAILYEGRVIGVWAYPDFAGSPISPKGIGKFKLFGKQSPEARKAAEEGYKRIVNFMKE